MYYIGIDLGTSAVKLLLMQGDGQIANIVSREYPIAFPHPGWSEQNPADWWDAVCAGIPELLNGFDASQVAGIGAGGQMHGLVVLDAQDKVIRPCQMPYSFSRRAGLCGRSAACLSKSRGKVVCIPIPCEK